MSHRLEELAFRPDPLRSGAWVWGRLCCVEVSPDHWQVLQRIGPGLSIHPLVEGSLDLICTEVAMIQNDKGHNIFRDGPQVLA